MEEIRAEDIFKVKVGSKEMIPMTPWVEIQFKVVDTNESTMEGIAKGKETKWETVSFRQASNNYVPPIDENSKSSLKFDNYFENITLEDNGGVLKCNMSLYDKDLSHLENIIIKSIVATKLKNELVERKLDSVPPKYLFEFLPNPSSNINFRIRFGYSDKDETGRSYEPALISSKEWKERVRSNRKDSIYLKSPWYYFMMMKVDFSLTEKGLVAKVEGMSISNTFLDKTKIIKRFVLLKGTPKKLLNDIAEQIYFATGGRVQVIKPEPSSSSNKSKKGKPIVPDSIGNEYQSKLSSGIDYGVPSDEPIQWKVEKKEEEKNTYPDNIPESKKRELEEDSKYLNITVPLGGEPRYEIDENGKSTGKIINEFMSLRDLLNEFVRKVPPILRNKQTGDYITDPEKIKKITSNAEDNEYDPKAFEQIIYTYSINEQTVNNSNDESKTDTNTLVLIRFFYRRTDNNKQEFLRTYSYMQAPTSIITSFNLRSKMDFIQLNQRIAVKGEDLSTLLSVTNKDDKENTGSAPVDISETVNNQLNNENFMLVSKVSENNSRLPNNFVANRIIRNLNQGIFFGDITILGDPFFLFDSELQPYQYKVKIYVYRKMDEYNRANKLQLSYLSGEYLVKKISHNISASGFFTTLSLEKYPEPTKS